MLRRSEVEERLGLKKTRLYDLIPDEIVPAPVPLSERCRRWVEHEIDACIEERVDLAFRVRGLSLAELCLRDLDRGAQPDGNSGKLREPQAGG